MFLDSDFPSWTWREYDKASTERRVRFRIYIIKKQKNACYSCNQRISYLNDVHHDHRSGEIKGLVCRSCNLKIIWLPQR